MCIRDRYIDAPHFHNETPSHTTLLTDTTPRIVVVVVSVVVIVKVRLNVIVNVKSLSLSWRWEVGSSSRR